MKRKLILIPALLCLGFFSCKDDDDEDKNLAEEEKIEEVKLVQEGEFVLSNQYSTDIYFSAKNMKLGSSTDFDFAFAYYDTLKAEDATGSVINSSFDYQSSTTTTFPKYFIAGGTSVDLDRLTSSNCSRSTTFYTLPDGFTSAKFDTIKTVAGLVSILEESKIVRNTVDKSCDAYFSDGFGWSEGSMVGFKTDEGKYGIIKIISTPYKYDRHSVGYIEIGVKFEGE